MSYLFFEGMTFREGDIIAPEEEVTFEGFQYSFEYWNEDRWERVFALDHRPVIFLEERRDKNGDAFCVFKKDGMYVVAYKDPSSKAFFVEDYCFQTFDDAIAFIES